MRILVTTSLVLWLSTLAIVTVFGANSNPTTNPLGGSSGSSQPICYAHWQSIGPFHVQHNYTDINLINDPEDIGAIHSVWVSGDIAYVGGVNGGVWKTTNFHSTATFGGPHWVPLTDQMDCLSIGAVAGSLDDTNLVVAGCGFQSNSAQRGGEARGAMITKDGGATWQMLTGFPQGYWISSITVSGTGASGTAIIVIAVKQAMGYYSGTSGNPVDPYGVGSNVGGIWVSQNGGTTFTQPYSATGVNKLYRHPSTPTTIYASALISGSAGSWTAASILVSTNSGVSWAGTAAAPNPGASQCTSQTTLTNVQVTVGAARIYAGYYLENAGVQNTGCYAMFKSDDGGSTWSAIANIPSITDSTVSLGTQGLTNFAILAYPSDSKTLFVAGTGSFAYRVDTSSDTWTQIATPTLSVVTGTTRSKTAPHADARNFAWDAQNGTLLVTDDGGLYSRSYPLSSTLTDGDWTSLAGDLSITEIYVAAYDPVSGAIALGAQDNTVMISQFDGTEQSTGIWSYLLTGDGTSVAVDTSVSPAQFYGSDQYLAGWFKVPVNANSAFGGVNSVVTTFSGTFGTCNPGDSTNCFDFVPATAANLINPSNVLVCTADSKCYKSTFPSTTSVFEFNMNDWSLSGFPTAYIYGGYRNGVANADVIFAVGQTFVWSRDVNTCASKTCMHSYSGSSCSSCLPGSMVRTTVPWRNAITNFRSVAQHPADYYINVIIDDAGHVWLTLDFGQSWLDVTVSSNLLAVSGHKSVDTMGTNAAVFINTTINGVQPLLIGTTYGTFVTFTTLSSSANYTFVKFGANLPKTIVQQFIYTQSTDLLLAVTFGRGIFAIQKISEILVLANNGNDTTTINSACTTPLYPNVPNAYGYISSGILPAAIGFPYTYPPVSSSSSSSTGAAASSSSSTASAASSSSSSSTAAAASSSSSSTAGAASNSSSSTAASASSSSSTAAATSSSSSSTAAAASSSSSTAGAVSSSSSTAAASSTVASSSSTGAAASSSSSTASTLSSSSSSSSTGGGAVSSSSSSTGSAGITYNVGIQTTRSYSCSVASATTYAYTMDGVEAPALTLTAGVPVTFNINVGPFFPFAITTDTSLGGTTAGVVAGPLSGSGSFTWTPQYNGIYYYECTTSGYTCMGDSITVTGGSDPSSSSSSSSSSTAAAAPSSSSSSTATSAASSSTATAVASSSTGVDSSSSTGGAVGSSSSSTGGVDPNALSFPWLRLRLTMNLTNYLTKNVFAAQLVKDLAVEMKTVEARILILAVEELVDGVQFVHADFTIADALQSQITTYQAVFNLFDSANTNTSWTGAILPNLFDIIANKTSPVTAALPKVQFGLSYNIDALPYSINEFAVRLISDVSGAAAVSTSRLAVNSIAAGSVQVAFVIAPPLTTGETPSTAVVSNFVTAVNDPESVLYEGTVTNATIASSVSVSTVNGGGYGSSTGAAVEDVDNSIVGRWGRLVWYSQILIGAAGILLLGLIILFFYCICRKKPDSGTFTRKNDVTDTEGKPYTPIEPFVHDGTPASDAKPRSPPSYTSAAIAPSETSQPPASPSNNTKHAYSPLETDAPVRQQSFQNLAPASAPVQPTSVAQPPPQQQQQRPPQQFASPPPQQIQRQQTMRGPVAPAPAPAPAQPQSPPQQSQQRPPQQQQPQPGGPNNNPQSYPIRPPMQQQPQQQQQRPMSPQQQPQQQQQGQRPPPQQGQQPMAPMMRQNTMPQRQQFGTMPQPQQQPQSAVQQQQQPRSPPPNGSYPIRPPAGTNGPPQQMQTRPLSPQGGPQGGPAPMQRQNTAGPMQMNRQPPPPFVQQSSRSNLNSPLTGAMPPPQQQQRPSQQAPQQQSQPPQQRYDYTNNDAPAVELSDIGLRMNVPNRNVALGQQTYPGRAPMQTQGSFTRLSSPSELRESVAALKSEEPSVGSPALSSATMAKQKSFKITFGGGARAPPRRAAPPNNPPTEF